MNQSVKNYISIADFLGEVLGSNTEIIIHDLSNYKKSIVYIVNGHISNRKIGDSITDLVLEFIASESKGNKQFICNYNSKTVESRLLYSSTYFIRDEKNKILGALCLNSDYHEMKKSMSFLTSLFPNYVEEKLVSFNNVLENLDSNPQEVTLNKIDTIINEFDVIPNRTTPEEKTEIISALYECGIFNIRGSVQEVANKLDMSEPSVYRYLKKIKTN
jgi:predicted transcriptional regulator YheO